MGETRCRPPATTIEIYTDTPKLDLDVDAEGGYDVVHLVSGNEAGEKWISVTS